MIHCFAVFSLSDFIIVGFNFMKIIIFGHTPTSEYQHSNPLEIWRSPSGGKIGIDCGCGFPHPLSQGRHPAYGRLACLRLDDMKVFYSEEDILEEVEDIVW